MLSVMLVACPYYPDRGFDEDVVENVPPQIDLSTLDPSEPLIERGTSGLPCNFFQVAVSGIRDVDNDNLRVRWVANNRLLNTRLVSEENPVIEPGQFVSISENIIPSAHFPELLAEASEIPEPGESPPTIVGVISLFVTDAPAWAIGADDLPEGGQAVA